MSKKYRNTFFSFDFQSTDHFCTHISLSLCNFAESFNFELYITEFTSVINCSSPPQHIMSLSALENDKLYETEWQTINKVYYITFSSISSLFLSEKLLIVRIFTQTPPFGLKMKYIWPEISDTRLIELID